MTVLFPISFLEEMDKFVDICICQDWINIINKNSKLRQNSYNKQDGIRNENPPVKEELVPDCSAAEFYQAFKELIPILCK
jgi:hypothetical protein